MSSKPKKITPKSELYNAHCSDYSNGFDIGFPAMHCNNQAHFHRISVENINPGSLNSVNIVANNGGGANEARVPWREKRGDAGRAWMFLNLQDDNTEVSFRIFLCDKICLRHQDLMAEWSNTLILSGAWVRIPLQSIFFFQIATINVDIVSET